MTWYFIAFGLSLIVFALFVGIMLYESKDHTDQNEHE